MGAVNRWTSDELDTLRDMAGQGYRADQIASCLPARTPSAILQRAQRLGISCRPHREHNASDELSRIQSRMRRLPDIIEDTELKLLRLYAEAKEYRMVEILHNPATIDEAWDREVALAKLEARYG